MKQSKNLKALVLCPACQDPSMSMLTNRTGWICKSCERKQLQGKCNGCGARIDRDACTDYGAAGAWHRSCYNVFHEPRAPVALPQLTSDESLFGGNRAEEKLDVQGHMFTAGAEPDKSRAWQCTHSQPRQNAPVPAPASLSSYLQDKHDPGSHLSGQGWNTSGFIIDPHIPPVRPFASFTLEHVLLRASAMGLIKDRQYRFKTLPRCISGRDLVEFLLWTRQARNRPGAFAVGRALLAAGLMAPVGVAPLPAPQGPGFTLPVEPGQQRGDGSSSFGQDGVGLQSALLFQDKDSALYTVNLRRRRSPLDSVLADAGQKGVAADRSGTRLYDAATSYIMGIVGPAYAATRRDETIARSEGAALDGDVDPKEIMAAQALSQPELGTLAQDQFETPLSLSTGAISPSLGYKRPSPLEIGSMAQGGSWLGQGDPQLLGDSEPLQEDIAAASRFGIGQFQPSLAAIAGASIADRDPDSTVRHVGISATDSASSSLAISQTNTSLQAIDPLRLELAGGGHVEADVINDGGAVSVSRSGRNALDAQTSEMQEAMINVQASTIGSTDGGDETGDHAANPKVVDGVEVLPRKRNVALASRIAGAVAYFRGRSGSTAAAGRDGMRVDIESSGSIPRKIVRPEDSLDEVVAQREPSDGNQSASNLARAGMVSGAARSPASTRAFSYPYPYVPEPTSTGEDVIEDTGQAISRGQHDFLQVERERLLAFRIKLESTLWREGWLVKEGHVVRNWKRRYFILQGRTLMYFRRKPVSRTSSSVPAANKSAVEAPAGTLDIRDYSLEKGFAVGPRASTCIRLSPRHDLGGEYLVCAETEADFVGWIKTISGAMREWEDLSKKAAALQLARLPPFLA